MANKTKNEYDFSVVPKEKLTKNLIYALIDPRSGDVRYIGKSTSGLIRPKEHLQPKRTAKNRTRNGNWVKHLLDNGLRPIIRILECKESPEELYELEKYYVKKMKEDGAKLNNHTEGGEGLFGKKHSLETKIKCSLAHGGMGPEAEKMVCELYVSGESTRKIASLTGFGATTVWNVLKRNEISKRTAAEGRTKAKGTVLENILDLYRQGMLPTEISNKLGISKPTVCRKLKKYSDDFWADRDLGYKGVPRRRILETEKQTILLLLQNGSSINNISTQTGISSYVIRRHLKDVWRVQNV
jgi:hypothetical protein